MNILKRFARKHFNKWDGILAFYIVYNPEKDGKNVFNHSIHPDLRQNEELNELLKQVADKVREFYENNPKLLEEVDCKIKNG